ncbi:MAG: Hint domain-containing protein, partial [Paracoccaceae bacterium]|nr:Hint domain-containing protein [Paracoccaceae bacterium]
MAFISEINFEGSDATTEWAEVALGPDDDPNDFVFSVYRDNGTLHTGAGILFGEFNLGDLEFATTVSVVPDPDDPGWTIYQIPVGIKTASSDGDEGSGLALTDISPGGGVVDFYSGVDIAPITATAGAAAGATSDNSIDYRVLEEDAESVQWDYEGNRYNGNLTPGDARLICFTRGTLIKTNQGERPIEDLVAGDMVLTMDHGY